MVQFARVVWLVLLGVGLLSCQEAADSPVRPPASASALSDTIELGYNQLRSAYYRTDSLPAQAGALYEIMDRMHAQMMRHGQRMAGGMQGQGMMGGQRGQPQKHGGGGMHRRMSSSDSTMQMREWHQQMMGMHAEMTRLHRENGREQLVQQHQQMRRRHRRMMDLLSPGGEASERQATEPQSAMDDDVLPDGQSLFAQHCASCHGASGQGAGPFPPLAEAEWATGNEETAIRILLHGLRGQVSVQGRSYNGLMPAFRNRLTDREVAALLTFVRSSWGNDADDVSVEEVREVWAESRSRSEPWTARELRSDDDGG